MVGNLVNNILYEHDTHLTTGFIGIRYLMPVLTQFDHSDLAYDLAVQTTYPSWGYMLANGATTLWELWQDKTGPAMNSHDHHMMGSVDAWFYEALGGINVDPDHPGYRHIRIEPQVVRDLTSVSATVGTVRGEVTSSWTHEPGVITLQVDVPVNSTATRLHSRGQRDDGSHRARRRPNRLGEWTLCGGNPGGYRREDGESTGEF